MGFCEFDRAWSLDSLFSCPFWPAYCYVEIHCVNDQRIKVLLVEDQEAFAELTRELLTEMNPGRFAVTHVIRLSEALARLGGDSFDVALLDLVLPDSHGLETHAAVKAVAPTLPIIVLTGLDDEKLALQAMRDGAQDYLLKNQLDGRMLARVLRYAIERKRAERALRQSEEFFRLISENVTDLIAVIDRNGQRLYNSPSYKTLFGDPSALVGTDAFGEVHPEDRERIRRVFAETLATGAGQRAEYRLLLKSGAVRHLESQGNAIRDESGRVCKLVVVSRDISERKEAEEALRAALADLEKSHAQVRTAQLQAIQSEKLEAVSTFAAGVAHEVKNPLQAIILGIDFLSTYVTNGDANASMVLGEMEHAVHRADAIIRGLLEFSAYNKRSVQDENLSAIIEQSLRSVETEMAGTPVVLVKNLAEHLPLLRLDLKTMKHVFINLFINAIRAMPGGGTLTVRTATHQLAENRPAHHLKAGDILVTAEVEDTGAGTWEDKLSETSSTTGTAQPMKKGNGLGLTVLKKIIELYGGMIETSERAGAGTRLAITFRAQPKH